MPVHKKRSPRSRIRKEPKGAKARSLSASEKAKLLEEVKRDWLSDVPMNEIVEKHGVSSASIFRWWKNADRIQFSRLSEASLFPIDISKTINTIAMVDYVPREILVECLIKVITWVRWPNEPEFHTLGIIRCLCSYVRKTTSSNNLSDLNEDWRKILFPYLSLEIVDSAFSTWAPFIPDYDIVSNGKSRNDDLDLYAKITHYLISDPFSHKGRMIRPSLKTAGQLLREGIFGRRWTMSDRTFQSRWRMRGISFPFLYIERYHSPLDWNINPQEANFAEVVDALLQDLEELKRYFAMVAWTQNRLLLQLDKRAQRGLHFADFSKSISPIPVEIPPLPEALRLAIQDI